MSYETNVTPEQQHRLDEMAVLVTVIRGLFQEVAAPGYKAVAGAPAAAFEQAPLQPGWTPQPWDAGATKLFHQTGLMYSLMARGHLSEMAGLLTTGEVFYSMPLLSRGVLENVARLYLMYVKPHHDGTTNKVTADSIANAYAAAYVNVINDLYSTHLLASDALEVDPSNASLQADESTAAGELARLIGVYTPLFDPATTDTTTRKKLMLGGVRPPHMTDLTQQLAAWIWPDPTKRPAPLYRELSGLAHGSLTAQLGLFTITDDPDNRRLTRDVPLDHIEYLVAISAILFYKALSALVPFYGWDTAPIKQYEGKIKETFPQFAI